MKIDKPRREIISVKIDNVLLAPIGSLTKIDNFSVLDHSVDPVPDSVGKNAARICEDHFYSEHNCVCDRQSPFCLLAMNFDYDVVIEVHCQQTEWTLPVANAIVFRIEMIFTNSRCIFPDGIRDGIDAVVENGKIVDLRERTDRREKNIIDLD